MSFLDDIRRAVIPREVSDFTEQVEDFVRPVTDPLRSGIAKIVPKEIKPYASTIMALAYPWQTGAAGFFGGMGMDALFQKMMTDPDDEDTDVDWLKSFMTGVGGATKGAAAKRADLKRVVDLDKAGAKLNPNYGTKPLSQADYVASMQDQGFTNVSPADYAAYKTSFNPDQYIASGTNVNETLLNRLNTGTAVAGKPSIANYLKTDALQAAGDFFTPFDFKDATGLLDYGKELGSTLTAAQAISTPSQVRDAAAALKAAEAEYAAYLNQLDADQRASIEADRSARIAAYKKYMGLAGYTEEEINEALMNAGYITAGDTVYAARGGRIGFANGTDEMGIGNFVEAEKVRTEFMDKIQRMLQRKKMEMQMNDPGLMRFMNAAIPGGEGFYTKEEMAFPDMEKRYKQHIKKMEMDQAADDYKMMERTKNKLGGYLDMLDNRDMNMKKGGRINRAMGTRTTPEGDPISPDVPAGMQMDLRGGGFIPLGTEPRADDVPAMVGKDEFVLNDRAVAGIGKMMTGVADPRAGAKALYELQNQMESIV